MISTIQKDIIIDGDIKATGDIIVHGRVNGSVNSRSLKIETDGSVVGDITAQSVVTNGAIKGKIYALSVSLGIGSNTESEITSNTLKVEVSATFNGKCHIGLNSELAKPANSVSPDLIDDKESILVLDQNPTFN